MHHICNILGINIEICVLYSMYVCVCVCVCVCVISVSVCFCAYMIGGRRDKYEIPKYRV